jgi:hypothetical protein
MVAICQPGHASPSTWTKMIRPSGVVQPQPVDQVRLG